MKKKCCLITGGAGFIGCAAADVLIGLFENVIAIDSLHPQIHQNRERPEALHAEVMLFIDDICDPSSWDDLLLQFEPKYILHLAAETGTGQSLMESTRHANVNVVGLTRMLDAFSQHQIIPEQIVIASSRAVYGEGAWRYPADGSVFYPGQRDINMLTSGQWDFPDAEPLPMAASTTIPNPTSVYGATKLAQEHILLAWGKSFNLPISILRLQNVYGPGQSLVNAYTGIVPLFIRYAIAGKEIPVYEDGEIYRDFVHIKDVAEAIRLIFSKPPEKSRILDIGTGRPISIKYLASIIARHYNAPKPKITGDFRNGDVRYAVSDPVNSYHEIGYKYKIELEDALPKLCEYISRML